MIRGGMIELERLGVLRSEKEGVTIFRHRVT